MNKLLIVGIGVFISLVVVFSLVYANRLDKSVVDVITNVPTLGKEEPSKLPQIGPLKCVTEDQKRNDPNCRWMDDALRNRDRP